MKNLEEYRRLGAEYDQAVKELHEIQAAEDRKKKQIHAILEKIKEVLK